MMAVMIADDDLDRVPCLPRGQREEAKNLNINVVGKLGRYIFHCETLAVKTRRRRVRNLWLPFLV